MKNILDYKQWLNEHKESDDFDWSFFTDMSPEDVEREMKEYDKKYQRDKKKLLDDKYKKDGSLNKKRLGRTRDNAINTLIADVKKYYDIEDDWSNRNYKTHGGTVTVGKHSEYEMRNVSVDKANEKRRNNRIEDAQSERWGALELLKKLGVEREEMVKLLISIGVDKGDVNNYLEIQSRKSFKNYKF